MFVHIVEKVDKKRSESNRYNACSDINHLQLFYSMLNGSDYNGIVNSHGSNAFSSAQDIID